MAKFKTREISIGEQSAIVDDDLHITLNGLADTLYSDGMGYASRLGFDYYASPHPMENQAYAMALLAYIYNRDFGLD